MSRSALLVLAGIAAGACAHVEAPRGGPDEFPPPQVVDIRPDTLAVLPGFRDDVRVYFQHRLSEEGLEEAVRVTPRTSQPVVSRHLERLSIGLREGWEPDVIYHVTVMPPLRDRFGGRLEDTLRIVFSTGPEIPDTRVEGLVTDRVTGEPVEDARVEAVRMADSLVYATYTDRGGTFRLDRIPEGGFTLRGFEDLNRNRALDPFEPRDVAEAEVADGEPVDLSLRLLEPDDTPPVAEEAVWDGARVVVTFDDPLDPLQDIGPGQIRVRDADGAALTVTRAVVSTADVEEAPPPTDPGEVDDIEEVEETPDPDPGRPEPLPSRDLHIYLAEPLLPGREYPLVVRGVRNLHGLMGEDILVVEVPEADPDEEEPDPAAEPAGVDPSEDA